MGASDQYEIDFKTGLATAILGESADDAVRSACHALNTERTRSLNAAGAAAASIGPVSPDVWATTFARYARECGTPLVDLERLGILHDEDGFVSSDGLFELKPGAEALPFLDANSGTVYKLFFLSRTGTLGKKLVLDGGVGEGFEVRDVGANWKDTMLKTTLLNAGGGLPSEIVGVASSGDYLITKQPRAHYLKDYQKDREEAVKRFYGITPIGGGLRRPVMVSHILGIPWIICDLHNRNIMRDRDGHAVIIDALIGEVNDYDRARIPWLEAAAKDAKHFRETGEIPRDTFGDVDDDEL